MPSPVSPVTGRHWCLGTGPTPLGPSTWIRMPVGSPCGHRGMSWRRGAGGAGMRGHGPGRHAGPLDRERPPAGDGRAGAAEGRRAGGWCCPAGGCAGAAADDGRHPGVAPALVRCGRDRAAAGQQRVGDRRAGARVLAARRWGPADRMAGGPVRGVCGGVVPAGRGQRTPAGLGTAHGAGRGQSARCRRPVAVGLRGAAGAVRRYDKSSWEPLEAAGRYGEPEAGRPLAGLVALLAGFGAVAGDRGRPAITPLGRWAAEHLAAGLAARRTRAGRPGR